jgi:signal peptidase
MSPRDPPGADGPERVDLGDAVDRSRPEGVAGWARWAVRTDHPTVGFVREVLGSVLGVLLVGLLLFAVSGIWPPMVAVESGSMEPHMYRGDLVFVMEEHRLAPSYATGETGVVTYVDATEQEDYRKFGDYGDVIVFEANGGSATPVIHRARFWVDEGENWVGEADPDYLPSRSCDSVPNCPAPHAGFITKGDNNGLYDQVAGISGPVRPSWVKGTAEFRIPWLGYVRLYFTELRTGERPGYVAVSTPEVWSPGAAGAVAVR